MEKPHSFHFFLSNMTNNNIFVISCDNNITVGDLKRLIYNKNKDLHPCLFRLIYKSGELNDDELFLNDVGLSNEDKLYFVMKLSPEKEILLYIKQKFNLQLNWSNEIPLNQWLRVTVSDNKVTDLDLSEMHLTGEIPTEIGKLSNLE